MHLTSPRTERQVTAAGVEQQEIKLGCVESSTNRLSLTEAQFTIIKTFKDYLGPSPSVSAIFCRLEVGLENKYCPEHLLQVLTRAANDGWNFKGAPVEKTKVGPSSNGDGTGTWVEGMCEKPSRTMGGASSFIKVQADQSEHCLSRSPQVITTTSTVVVRQPASPTFT
ncbi:unnamed protein product [Fusarium graminearum]|uniref:Uncharacterized protein n=1 Tax=Gibberella zeae TaxID=5518 RepID=A0A4E9E8F0_GIBZA|nr:unnamed protein product [Fusarium graminearum]CAF3546009.1 unnamed protein product [Fusarium graminearum]CAG2009357.1 unnamed protein product [Fusarium graminearum]CAG2010176.1 unnamed protein product [Fusarium graminearum]